jgi:hypothetical protein
VPLTLVALSVVDRSAPVVASLESAIFADELISASTITFGEILVTVFAENISPLRFGILVVDVAVPDKAPSIVVAVIIPEALMFVPLYC